MQVKLLSVQGPCQWQLMYEHSVLEDDEYDKEVNENEEAKVELEEDEGDEWK
jgi:hypothetical protein